MRKPVPEDRIYAALERDEGVKHVLYRDSVGVPTVGVGHNLTVPLSARAIRTILEDDVAAVDAQLPATIPFYTTLSSARQGVLRNMGFNLGMAGLVGFSRTLRAMSEGRWQDAHDAMLQSRWAGQVGTRAQRLAQQLLTDQWV